MLLGLRVSLMLLLPLGFMCALVPFGDELIPFLQDITAQITIVLTRWSGIPAMISGIYIDTPAGLFIVAEACSGVKFLIAMVTLGFLVCFTAFDRWSMRVLFMLSAVVVPILANGVRAWGTIFIAQSQGVEFAAGFDHIFYGWIFFGIVIAILLGGFWRLFEREPEDAGYTASELAQMNWIARFEGRATGMWTTLAIIAGCILTAWLVNTAVSG
jgi:exosortase